MGLNEVVCELTDLWEHCAGHIFHGVPFSGICIDLSIEVPPLVVM